MRILTSEEKKFIQENTRFLEPIWFPIGLGIIFILAGFPALVQWEISWAPFLKDLHIIFWLGWGFAIFGGIFNFFWTRIQDSSSGLVRRKALEKILKEGKITQATLINVFQNHQYQQGPHPLTVAVFRLSDQSNAYFGTFSPSFFSKVSQGSVISGYHHPLFPNIFVPDVKNSSS